jgi:hypothetical protein
VYPTALEAVRIAVRLLEEEFELRETASEAFLLTITSSYIRASVRKYKDEMLAASERGVYCCCSRFVGAGDIHEIHEGACFNLLLEYTLDHCRLHDKSWDFCTTYHSAVCCSSIPKFSASNFINVVMCQDYLSALDDLTTVEECLIAKCHPVRAILKLQPGGHSSPSTYNAICGYMIVILQDPGPLLQILPSPELRLDNLIKVFWLG